MYPVQEDSSSKTTTLFMYFSFTRFPIIQGGQRAKRRNRTFQMCSTYNEFVIYFIQIFPYPYIKYTPKFGVYASPLCDGCGFMCGVYLDVGRLNSRKVHITLRPQFLQRVGPKPNTCCRYQSNIMAPPEGE